MNILVNYVSFHPDNYQGGSGESFEFTLMVRVPDSVLACQVVNLVTEQVEERASSESPFNQDHKIAIQSMTIV